MNQSRNRLLSQLRNAGFFAEVDDETLRELISELKWIALKAGETLLRQGDPSASMYVVAAGRLDVSIDQPCGTPIVVGEIGPGETAGEMQILTGGKRTATVRAQGNVELVELPKDVIRRLMDRNPKMAEDLAVAVRRRIRRNLVATILPKLLGPHAHEALDDIETYSEWFQLKQGEVLFHQGAPGDSLYIVISGRLRVVREDGSGSEREVGMVTRGESVGEMALFTGEARTATVYGFRDSELIRFSEEAYRQISERYPQILRHVTANIIQRLSRAISAKKRCADVENIAVVPMGREVPLTEFVTRLAVELSDHTSVLHLSRERLDSELETPGISQIPEHDPGSLRLRAWLDEQDTRYQFILYQADPIDSIWTKRCLRQADRVLLVGQAMDEFPAPETEFLMPESMRGTQRSHVVLVLLHRDRSRLPRGTGAVIRSTNARHHFHVAWDSPADFGRLSRFLAGRSIGVVLGGGGVRGYAHIGVVQALKEAGIPVDVVGGTSMGAAIASHVALETDPVDIVRLHKELHANERPYKEYTIPVISLLGGRRLNRKMEEYYGGVEIEDLWLNFFCVSTNITKAEINIHRSGSVWQAVRASLSVPGIFAPIIDHEQLLVDGCLVNNLPGDVMRDLYGGTVMVVNVTPKDDLSFESSLTEVPSASRYLRARLNPLKESIDIPTILTVIMRSSMVGSAQRLRQIVQEADFCFEPPVGGFGLTEYESIEKIVDAGYRHAQQRIEEWAKEPRFEDLLK